RHRARSAGGVRVRRVLAAGIPLDGAADHGVSEAIYLRDPDDNGVELYRDRPQGEWPKDRNGKLQMYTRPLDLRALLNEADESVIGHAGELDEERTGPKDLA